MFLQHCKGANYRCRVWRLSLENDPTYKPVDEHGWCFVKEGNNNVISIN